MILQGYAKYFYGVGLLLLLFMGCPNSSEDDSWDAYDAAVYREIVTVIPAGTNAVISGSGGDGVFVAGRTITLSPYGISRYEVTWELWDEVYSWAVARGYRIFNRGIEGHGTSGTGDGGKGWTAAQRKTRPVTSITWRDAIVWCNAYSEMHGLEPVYYENDDGPVLKRSLSDIPPAGGLPNTAADLVVVKPGAGGFRLPSEAEWEYAARGGGPAADWNYPYPGSNDIEDVAWYLTNSYELGSGNAAYGVHRVGSKSGGFYDGANLLGLYDMAGNVSEYCWDWFDDAITASTPVDGPDMGTFAHRVMRGGGWSSYAVDCDITKGRNYTRPWVGSVYVGFRVAKNLQEGK
ncbi:formylglycine-generating enzyme family protein [Treponema primitia]|uniref:formylglycine-generating enzyme family protein n=1 Tax=Treponema primitia TaxID=88058 RepID=UPI000255508F|nr:SUMF1/EgtB/PvdO family nonheme iron enzyme [Treponema primitia]